MKKILFALVILLFFSCQLKKKNKGSGDSISNIKVAPESFIKNLSVVLNENSGLIIYDKLLWTFNDSGGESKIYGINFSGKIEKEIVIENAKNVDWESITQDKKYIYIGDFGNNRGARKDQTIYKIKKEEINTKSKQKLKSKKIHFDFENQMTFNYEQGTTPFDCEAMISFNGALYIFTKDRSDRTTTIYKIPVKKGEYKILPIDKFDVKGLITGADISPDKKTLALVGSNNYNPMLWLFSNFTSDNFFDGKKTLVKLDSIGGAQTEGICYLGNDSLLISCERNFNFEEQIFLLNLKNIH